MSVVLLISVVLVVCVGSATQVQTSVSDLMSTNYHKLPPRRTWIFGFAAICLVCLALCSANAGQKGQAGTGPVAASEPSSKTQPEVEFVGNETCAKCHSSIYESYKVTPMAHSSGAAMDNLLLADFIHPEHAAQNLSWRDEVISGRTAPGLERTQTCVKRADGEWREP